MRPRDGRVVGGVAGALATVAGVDRALVRVGFVATVLFGGFGVLAYLLTWATLPSEGESDAPLERALRRVGALPPAARVLLGGVFVLLVVGGLEGGGGPGAAVALIVAGVLLLHSDTVAQRSLGAPTATAVMLLPVPPSAEAVARPPAAAQVDEVTRRPYAGGTAGVLEPATIAVPAVPAPPEGLAATPPSAAGPGQAVAASAGRPVPPASPIAGSGAIRAPLTTPAYGGGRVAAPGAPVAARRPPSLLGALTIGFGLLALGTASVLDAVSLVQLGLEEYLALALVAIGAGLVVGAFVGRARWLALLGLLLVVPLAVTQVAGDLALDVSGGVGERTVRVTDPADLDEGYRLGIGSLELDLRDLELEPGRTAVVEASVGLGELVVSVPPDVRVEGVARVRGGEVRLPDGSRFSGPGERAILVPGNEEEEGAGRVELRLDAAFGEIRVQRSG